MKVSPLELEILFPVTSKAISLAISIEMFYTKRILIREFEKKIKMKKGETTAWTYIKNYGQTKVKTNFQKKKLYLNFYSKILIDHLTTYY